MIPLLGEAAIAIGASLALSLIVKATIVSIAALTAVRMARRAPASIRHLLLASGFFVLLALPVATLIVPALELGVPITSPVLAVSDTAPATVNVTLELALDSEARDALATTPIVYQSAFVLLPGRYRIRVLVRDQATDRIGVIDVPFFVPNLNRVK